MHESNIIHRAFVKNEILALDEVFYPSSVSVLTLKIDDFVYEFPWEDCMEDDEDGCLVSLRGIENQYADRLASCKIAALHNNTPLHDETYCYSKTDQQWYLIAEGKGYA